MEQTRKERRDERLENARYSARQAAEGKNYVGGFLGKIDLTGSFSLEELEAIVFLAKNKELF